MKRVSIIVAILLTVLLCGCAEPECPVCGDRGPLVECPVCYSKVCERCADSEHFIEDLIEQLYDSGEMEDYLIGLGYYVYMDSNDAINDLIDEDPDAVFWALVSRGYLVENDE
jgi:hypothetical protein